MGNDRDEVAGSENRAGRVPVEAASAREGIRTVSAQSFGQEGPRDKISRLMIRDARLSRPRWKPHARQANSLLGVGEGMLALIDGSTYCYARKYFTSSYHYAVLGSQLPKGRTRHTNTFHLPYHLLTDCIEKGNPPTRRYRERPEMEGLQPTSKRLSVTEYL